VMPRPVVRDSPSSLHRVVASSETVCVCACVCACMRACVRACVRVCVCVWRCASVWLASGNSTWFASTSTGYGCAPAVCVCVMVAWHQGPLVFQLSSWASCFSTSQSWDLVVRSASQSCSAGAGRPIRLAELLGETYSARPPYRVAQCDLVGPSVSQSCSVGTWSVCPPHRVARSRPGRLVCLAELVDWDLVGPSVTQSCSVGPGCPRRALMSYELTLGTTFLGIRQCV
jgi:hypothetical protein